jgi:hypothetical protein
VLYDHGRHPAGIHFRGPTFEPFDGSNVVGTLQASVPAPDPGGDPLAVTPCRLQPGRWLLGEVDYVQRVQTKGGVARSGACDPQDDSTLAVPYQARCLFYSDGQ